jgi:serine/threonine protein kinase
MEQAARKIDDLNQCGTIHGDVKPQNLLLVGDSVELCGFELARAVANRPEQGMGTVAYAAPELFVGKPHTRSDQYCLAVSYTELRTGSLPFEERNPYKIIQLHRKGRLDLRRLPGRERSVIKRATAIKPEKRWPSCFEMVRRLREACTEDLAKKRSWMIGRWMSRRTR